VNELMLFFKSTSAKEIGIRKANWAKSAQYTPSILFEALLIWFVRALSSCFAAVLQK